MSSSIEINKKTLFQLVTELKDQQRKNTDVKVDTEYILPYRIKRAIITKCNEISFEKPLTSTERSKVAYCITIINQYRFYDPILEKVLFYLSEATPQLDEILKRFYVHTYVSVDSIPQPFYQTIKDTIEAQQIHISTLFSYHCYVLFMIGKVIGFVFVKENTIGPFHFESDEIKSIFDKKYPSLVYM